jgi:hypothetical protein
VGARDTRIPPRPRLRPAARHAVRRQLGVPGHRVRRARRLNLNIIVNETGTIQLRLPIDLDDPRRTWAAFWALDEEGRGTTNIHVRVEMMGARVCGRMKPRNGVTVVRGEKGDEVVIDFLDDIEELKFVHTAGNPFLPISLIQQPKAWMLLLQADHAILLTLAANLLRLKLATITVEIILNLLNPAHWTIEGIWSSFAPSGSSRRSSSSQELSATRWPL